MNAGGKKNIVKSSPHWLHAVHFDVKSLFMCEENHLHIANNPYAYSNSWIVLDKYVELDRIQAESAL